MATDLTIPIVPVADQENMSRLEEDAPVVENETSAPLNFPELTPHQFGISVESFIPSSSSCKDKSRLAQIKARRRSSVGVRGSPETNSLIRFRAQQRMKTPPASHSAELVRSSPFFPRVASTLRQKMASFQRLMDVVESDACDPMPEQDSDTEGCILTQDYLSDGIRCSEGKENHPPATPTPSKKRRLGLPEGCSVEIREGNISVPHSSLKEQEDPICKHQSPSRPPSDDPSAVSLAQQSHLFFLPSLLEMKQTVDVDMTPVVRKKKQVRFGGPLSPEFFDKNLPPSTPLQKGGTPARAPTPGGGLQLRPVLKTPQRSESDQNQPETLSPTGFGESPTFAVPHKHRISCESDDKEDGKIVFPSMEETDSAVSSDTECAFDGQPVNLSLAFDEECLSPNLSADPESNQTSQMDVIDECECVAEEMQPEGDAESQVPTLTKSRRKTKKDDQFKSEPRAAPGKRKRKQPEDSEPVKRSTRSAAKSACRKMKVASTAARRWNKDIDRSLYGSRAYASKNPSLSPIRERLSFISQSPALQQSPGCSAATKQEFVANLEIQNGSVHREDFTEAKALGNISFISVTPPTCSPGKASRQTRSTGRRGQKKERKAGVTDSVELQEEIREQHFKGQASLSFEMPQGTPSVHTQSEQCEADPEEPPARISVDIPCTDSSKWEYDASLLCTPLVEEPNNTEPTQKQAKQGRRSTALLESQPAEESQVGYELAGNGVGGRAAAAEQGQTQSSSDLQVVVGGLELDLAPWQADFNLEDVFQPVASRRQRSVRRSLRNQANSEHGDISAGLAWVPRSSPDSVKETRRRSRKRRLIGALPVQHPLPEEVEDSTANENH